MPATALIFALLLAQSGGGAFSVTVTNTFTEGVNVSVLPISGSCSPLPLSPAHLWLPVGATSPPIVGNVAACEVAVEVSYKNNLAQTCAFNVMYDPSSGTITLVPNPAWTGADTTCTAGQSAPSQPWAITYQATLGQ
jgi:hypothetical protein